MTMIAGAQLALLLDTERAAIDAACREKVRWQHATRVNIDARLVLLGLQGLISRTVLDEAGLRECALVFGCRQAALDSYQSFAHSCAAGSPAPLAFSHALPSVALSCASLAYRLRGPLITLVGDADVGLRALEHAELLVRCGRVRQAIAGCWEWTPARSAAQGNTGGRPSPDRPDSDRCRLVLALIGGEPTAALQRSRVDGFDGFDGTDDGPVTRMMMVLAQRPAPGNCRPALQLNGEANG